MNTKHDQPSDFERALIIATAAHRGQVDREGHPYILHPIRVALRANLEHLMVIGLLHDVIEDSAFSAEEIEAMFGSHVANAVVALSRKPNQTYEDFIKQVATNGYAVRVKIYDLQDNLDPAREDGLTDSLRSRYEKALHYLQEGI